VTYVVSQALGLGADGSSIDLFNAPGGSASLAQSLAAIQNASAEVLDQLLPGQGPPRQPFTVTPPNQDGLLVDAEAFGRFHSEYHERVVESIAGLVRDRDKAEDIAARAFQVGWEKRQGFRGDASLHTWIQSIARRSAWESMSRDRSAQFESLDRADAREIPAPGRVTDELEKQDNRLRLQYALAQVPVKFCRPLIAHFVHDLSSREIARRQRVPFNTVLTRIHKAKRLLREAWEESFANPYIHKYQPAISPNFKPQMPSPDDPKGNPQPPIKTPEPDIWNR
jgi:RNA polymerase sigma-70 factor, ECF subfamily